MSPPVASGADTLPEDKESELPLPEPLEPTTTEIEPADPAAAEPVDSCREPDSCGERSERSERSER